MNFSNDNHLLSIRGVVWCFFFFNADGARVNFILGTSNDSTIAEALLV